MTDISVIIPIYKVEAYLCRCVDSFLSQSFTNFELILVDDGSPDRCPQICDEYAVRDSRIRVIHKENGGVSSARNIGLDAAKGDYVAFCDSDDYVSEDWLQTLYEAMTSHKADLVVAGYTAVDADGTFVEKTAQQSGIRQLQTYEDRIEYLLGVLQKDENQHGWEVNRRLFKNRILQDHHIRFCTTCGNYAEDQAFVLEYGLHAAVVVALDHCGYRYYVDRQDSMMNTTAMNMKLNEANQASAYFGERFFKNIQDPVLQKQYAVLHYLMMYQEYQKVVYNERFSTLGEATKSIQNQTWYRRHTRSLAKCKDELIDRFGKKNAYRILLLSRYCLHKSWKRYALESAFAYKFKIPKV